MAKFTYTLANREGRSESGSVEAVSREGAARQIKRDGWFLVSVKKAKEGFSFFSSSHKLSSFERIILTDHLAAMFRGGTPLVEALETYRDDEEKKGSAIIEEMISGIQQGRKLSEVMAVYPEAFSPLYLALVQTGELTGSLDETLGYLARELRREHEFHERIKSALFYPVLVLSVAFLVILLLVLVVIPKIILVTKSLSGDLPLMTRIVSSAASFLTAFGPLLILLFLGLVVTLFFLLRNKKTREKLDPYLLRLPLVGRLIKKYILARFLRVVGSCLQYGVPLGASFATIGKIVSNVRYQQACDRIEAKIMRGLSLSEALGEEETTLFPRIIVRTIKGAEKTGSVDEAMLRLSQFYEDDIDRGLKRATDLIEPALVIVLGIIVAAIAISVIAPIYQMTSKIK